MDFAKLTAPFAQNEISWRVQNAGISNNGTPWAMIIPYVDARVVQNRLDTVLGAQNWQVMYRQEAAGFICSIEIWTGDRWVTKMDGSEHTEIEPFKGGISKAFVRAASAWGIGRHLYDTPTTWAKFCPPDTPGAQEVKIDGKKFFWLAPNLSTHNPELAVSPNKPLTAAPACASEGGDLGDFVFSFGKFKGKRLADIATTEKGVSELQGWVNWLHENAAKENKPLAGSALIAANTVEDFFATRQ